MHPKNIINEIRQMATGLFGNFYLGKKVLQIKLWRALAKDSSTQQLLELKILLVRPIFQLQMSKLLVKPLLIP
jgi:hypothetical protein